MSRCMDCVNCDYGADCLNTPDHRDTRIAKLEKALQFYAEKSNYDSFTAYARGAEVQWDNGNIAREALEYV